MVKFSSIPISEIPQPYTKPNVYRVEGDEVRFNVQENVETVIDALDLERVRPYRWVAYQGKHSKNRSRWYVQGWKGGRFPTPLHRLITNAPHGLYVDHKNHNSLDNRRSNLRVVTHQENDANRDGSYNTSKTGIRGVSVHKTNNHDAKRYYVFRCHIQQCKANKFFPLTDEGLEQARAFSEDHYAQILERGFKPTMPRQSATGIKGISIMNHKGQPYRYHARCVVNGEARSAIFPYSPEGLKAAEQTLEAWRSE